MVKLYKKADKGLVEYRHFTLNRWSFKNDALKELYNRLSCVDKEQFDFNFWNVRFDFLLVSGGSIKLSFFFLKISIKIQRQKTLWKTYFQYTKIYKK